LHIAMMFVVLKSVQYIICCL